MNTRYELYYRVIKQENTSRVRLGTYIYAANAQKALLAYSTNMNYARYLFWIEVTQASNV
jgi:hypothetical protein